MKLIATLTTLPSRIAYLEPVLTSILNQSLPPDEIHLQLPKHCLKEKRGYELPDFLADYKQVKVYEHDQDYGPATKWLPALTQLQGQERLLLIMDDDCHYPSEMVANLHKYYQRDANKAYCSTGGVLQGKKIRQFIVNEELHNHALTILRNNREAKEVDTVQGFSLILFNPDLIPQTLIDFLKQAQLARLADDIVLSAVFEKSGINRIQIAPYQIPQPLDQAEINPIHGEGRLTEMSMQAFYWAQRELSVWKTYEFVTERKASFLRQVTKPISVIKGKVVWQLKQWVIHRSKYKNYAFIVCKNVLRTALFPVTDNKYLFVLGATHGGTTLLTELLSKSANVSSNNYLDTREGQLLPTVRDYMFTHKRQWEEDLEIDWSFVKREWRKYWDVRKKILLEKSPPNLLRASAIEAAFSPAYFLIFVRDPYAHCETFIRKNDFSPRQAAEFVVRTLKIQQRNMTDLKRAILVHYEALVEDPELFKDQLIDFLAELSDIQTTGVFNAHNYHKKPQVLRNFNQEKIDRLNASDLNEINQIFNQHKSLLEFFGYNIQSKATFELVNE